MQCGRVGRRLLSDPSPGHFTEWPGLFAFGGRKERGEGRRRGREGGPLREGEGAEAGTAAMRLSTQDGMGVEVVGGVGRWGMDKF